MSLITTEVRGRVGLMTLNDPDKRNAITLAMNDEIGSALDAWEADEGIGAVVLTGAGRGFCAGADLDDLMAGSALPRLRVLLGLRARRRWGSTTMSGGVTSVTAVGLSSFLRARATRAQASARLFRSRR